MKKILISFLMILMPVFIACSGSSKKNSAGTVNTQDVNLSSLVISDVSIVFDPAKADYGKRDVSNTVASVKVIPTASDPDNVLITVNTAGVNSGGEYSIDLIRDTYKQIDIKVANKSDPTANKTYTISVRQISTAVSDNNYLSSITISSGTLVFYREIADYSVEVESSVDSITVSAEAESSAAEIAINKETLKSKSITLNAAGSSTVISISVMAQDGSYKTYTLTVYRLAVGEVSSNADLSYIALSAGSVSPVFSGATTSYTAEEWYSVTGITVTPTVTGIGASVSVNGTSVVSGSASSSIPVNIGDNLITIIVKAQNGSTVKTYTVTVTRRKQAGIVFSKIDSGTKNDLSACVYGNKTYVIPGGNKTNLVSSDASSWTTVNAGGWDANGVIVSSTTKRIVYGSGGHIITTDDTGATWTERTSGTSETINDGSYYDSLIILAGANGLILKSTDAGVTWTVKKSGVTDDLQTVRFVSSSVVLVVGDNGSIVRSADSGVTWTKIDSNVRSRLRASLVVDSSCYMCGEDGVVVCSDDAGASFKIQVRPVNTEERINSMTYLSSINTYFLGARNGVLRRTSDTWSPWVSKVMPSTNIYGFREGFGKLFAYGDNYVYSSTDNGATWISKQLPLSNAFASSLYNSVTGKLILRGDNGYVVVTSDGENWSAVSLGTKERINSSFSGSGTYGYGVTGINQTVCLSSAGDSWTVAHEGPDYTLSSVKWIDDKSMFIGVGNKGTIATSADGKSWTVQTSGTTLPLNQINWTGSKFIACGTDGVVLTSPDGVTWTISSSAPMTERDSTAAWISSGSYYIFSEQTGKFFTSPDGITFTERTNPTGVNATSYATVGSTTVFGHMYGKISVTRDGKTWTEKSSDVTSQINRVRSIGSRFIVFGQCGTILTSDDDGETWVKRNSGTLSQITRAEYDSKNNLIVAVGDTGLILTSPDGITWTKRYSGVTCNFTGVACCNGRIIITGENGTLLVSDGSVEPSAVTSVTLSGNSGSIRVSRSKYLFPVITPSWAANQSIVWSSSDDGIAKVGVNGRITGVSAGTVTITATSQEGTIAGTATVTVKPVAVSSFTLNKSSYTVERPVSGKTLQLSVASMYPSDAVVKSLTWTTGDSSVATVNSSGLVSYVGDGSTTITATATSMDDSTVYAACTVGSYSPAGATAAFSATSGDFVMISAPAKKTYAYSDTSTSTVSQYFWIAQTELTYELWNEVKSWATDSTRGSGIYSFAGSGQQGYSNSDGSAVVSSGQPVSKVSWRDAIVWCNAFTEYYNYKTGASLDCVYCTDSAYSVPFRTATAVTTADSASGSQDNPYIKSTGKGFRLPSLVEWELAARYISDANSDGDICDAGEYYGGYYVSGDTSAPAWVSSGTVTQSSQLPNYAVFKSIYTLATYTTISTGVISTATVKSKTANALGLYDMCGNVSEWCADGSSSNRLIKGGGSEGANYSIYIGYTSGNSPYSISNIGLRPVRAE